MHKSYQPILPSSNKLLKKKWDETYYNEHRRLVKTAKPMVDTTAPRQHPHVVSKQKKEQLQRERAEIIDRDNMTLMKKMDSITHRRPGGPGLDHINQYHGKHHSLNLEQRERESKRVVKENEATLKRIQQVRPHYKSTNWGSNGQLIVRQFIGEKRTRTSEDRKIDDWREKQKLTQLITSYPHLASPTKQSSAGIKSKDKELLKTDETTCDDTMATSKVPSDDQTINKEE